jgi:Domain of unknown function (DUF4430)
LSKLKTQLPRFGLLLAGLVALTLFTTLGGLWQYRNELTDQSAAAQTPPAAAKKTPPSLIIKPASSIPNQTPGVNQVSAAATANHPANQSPAQNSTGGAPDTSPPPAAALRPAAVSLGLSINGQPRGTVTLPASSNQCDVLSQALTDGIISSLDMRYSTQYGTEAVYVIDGIGDPSSVWWTYTVNGRAPPYGCAYATVQGGDSVNWRYVKG